MNPLLSFFVNLILPWDFTFAYLANRYLNEISEMLPIWLKRWHELEALLSISNFAYLNPTYTYPDIRKNLKEALHMEALGHPLLPQDKKKCNDFSVQQIGDIALITGSNMAGKTTFIKTIGVNLCLAYAGGPVNASRFVSYPFSG